MESASEERDVASNFQWELRAGEGLRKGGGILNRLESESIPLLSFPMSIFLPGFLPVLNVILLNDLAYVEKKDQSDIPALSEFCNRSFHLLQPIS
jgi:hypothetical protein